MKKKLEAELISIAHKILQLKDTATLPQLRDEARKLYEKLTILCFAESHFAGPQPTIGQVREAVEKEESKELKEIREKIKAIIEPTTVSEAEEKPKVDKPIPPVLKDQNKKQTSDSEDKPELIIEKINARVTEDLFVPATTVAEEGIANSETQDTPSHKINNDQNEAYIDHEAEQPKSLNDQLRKDIHIGLNDRLAYIKYLFEGSAADYNRVLSQLSTIQSKNGAQDFINTMIKPDYNNWNGKEEYAERFMDTILSKYEH